MSQSIEVQEWTTEEIYGIASQMVAARLGISLSEFVKGYREKAYDTCEYIEVVGLLSLLAEDDVNFVGEKQAA